MSRVLAYHRPRLGKWAAILWVPLLTLLGTGFRPATLRAEQAKDERQREATDLVNHALRYEAQGRIADRNALLKWALEKMPEFAPAMWHSGLVRLGDKWVPADDVQRLATADKYLSEYRDLRRQFPETIDGQLRLAQWCAKHGLRDQERAHLTKVLQFDADHATARQTLGFVK